MGCDVIKGGANSRKMGRNGDLKEQTVTFFVTKPFLKIV